MAETKCLECGRIVAADAPVCAFCGKRMADERDRRDRRNVERRFGLDIYAGLERRRGDRRRRERRSFSY